MKTYLLLLAFFTEREVNTIGDYFLLLTRELAAIAIVDVVVAMVLRAVHIVVRLVSQHCEYSVRD